jgi:hypothetical protein
MKDLTTELPKGAVALRLALDASAIDSLVRLGWLSPDKRDRVSIGAALGWLLFSAGLADFRAPRPQPTPEPPKPPEPPPTPQPEPPAGEFPTEAPTKKKAAPPKSAARPGSPEDEAQRVPNLRGAWRVFRMRTQPRLRSKRTANAWPSWTNDDIECDKMFLISKGHFLGFFY